MATTQNKSVDISEILQKMPMAEINKAEAISGCSMSDLETEGFPKGLFMAAIGWVIQRRTLPKFSWAQAQQLTIVDIAGILDKAFGSNEDELTSDDEIEDEEVDDELPKEEDEQDNED